MSLRWRVVDCSLMEGRISSVRGALLIEKDNLEPTNLPLADVSVLLVGVKVRFSAAAMHRLFSQDIAVVFCDWKGVPEGAAYAWGTHNRIAARHRAQAKLSVPRQKNAWGRLIKAKISGQAAVLKDQGRQDHRQLEALVPKVRSGDPDNLEARAARIYWHSLWGSEDFVRIPGQGISNRNAHLDYAYTVLRGLGIRAVVGAGLSAAVGIFHRNRSNNFSLVDDLIEPFRPAVDDAVADLPCDAPIEDPEVRKCLVAASSRKFLRDGRTISSAFDELAQRFGQYVEGDISKLTVVPWQGRS